MDQKKELEQPISPSIAACKKETGCDIGKENDPIEEDDDHDEDGVPQVEPMSAQTKQLQQPTHVVEEVGYLEGNCGDGSCIPKHVARISYYGTH